MKTVYTAIIPPAPAICGLVFFGRGAAAQPVARKRKKQVQRKKAPPYDKRYVVLP